MQYRTSWKSLLRRKILFRLSLFFGPLSLFLNERLKHGHVSPALAPIAALGPTGGMALFLLIVTAAYFFMLAFRCPRCHKRFLRPNADNRECTYCGLPINS